MAIAAFDTLKNGISSLDLYSCWGLIQIILASTANISKVFWPAYDKCRAEKDEQYALRAKQYSLRGKYLRELLSIDKKSPLNSRDLRNYFEHYDENLHTWAEKSNHVIIRRNIAPKGAIKIGNVDKYADMGNLDPNDFILTFWDQKVEIPVLIKSVEDLLETVKKKSAERFFRV
jgi:hypothetical protein